MSRPNQKKRQFLQRGDIASPGFASVVATSVSTRAYVATVVSAATAAEVAVEDEFHVPEKTNTMLLLLML